MNKIIRKKIYGRNKPFRICPICKKEGQWIISANMCLSCYQNKRMKERRKQFRLERGGKCSICGYDKCLEALDFHHLDASKREFGFSRAISKNYSDERINKELDRCILVCANCHREIHYKEKMGV